MCRESDVCLSERNGILLRAEGTRYDLLTSNSFKLSLPFVVLVFVLRVIRVARREG